MVDFFQSLGIENINARYAVAVSIFGAIFLLIPLFIQLLLPIIKNKLSTYSQIYLYAFSTGFFIVLATLGFLHEGLEIAVDKSSTDVFPTASGTGTNPMIYLIVVPIMVGGIVLGLGISYLVKFVFVRKFNKIIATDKNASVLIHSHSVNNESHLHTHPEYIFNKSDSLESATNVIKQKSPNKTKLVALILLLTHRVFAGLLIGWSINQLVNGEDTSLSWAFIVSFWLHLIPEELVFYYRLREAGYKRWQSLRFSVFGLLLLLPFMFIGVYGASLITSLWYLKAILFALIGGIFLFNSLIEFLPEFYHVDMEKKKWFITLATLLLGIVFAVFILSFHSH